LLVVLDCEQTSKCQRRRKKQGSLVGKMAKDRLKLHSLSLCPISRDPTVDYGVSHAATHAATAMNNAFLSPYPSHRSYRLLFSIYLGMLPIRPELPW
jgi:hypothetical protein